MKPKPISKRTLFNDPIYGFISVKHQIIFDLIEHPWFQRLRRISQLGLTHLVYSGAHHTRFHHAMGAMHLMQQAVEVLRSKDQEITGKEEQGVLIAILLHDIGHGPFSHTLEHSIVEGISHESVSALFMDRLNEEFEGELDLALKIFRNQYKKKFLHQLVSSQLDMDRLDYLKRDSFFSGVSEGVISSDRIIKMLNVANDELAVEVKGIYSIEKFLIARRLMYWQVYLHKTVLTAEFLLMKILQRAKELAFSGEDIFCTPALKKFLYNRYGEEDFINDPELLHHFAELDDNDVMASVKVWTKSSDRILAILSDQLIDRKLYKVELKSHRFPKEKIDDLRNHFMQKLNLNKSEIKYFVFTEKITNSAYNHKSDRINILYKEGVVQDIADAADLLNISVLSRAVNKWLLCYPKE